MSNCARPLKFLSGKVTERFISFIISSLESCILESATPKSKFEFVRWSPAVESLTPKELLRFESICCVSIWRRLTFIY